MGMSGIQVKMARMLLNLNGRDFASGSGIGWDVLVAIENDRLGIAPKNLVAVQNLLERSGIEFISDKNTVALHNDKSLAAAVADPDMPTGARLVY